MKHFFLTGLPRCKSAFFANLLTYGDSFCYHDAFLGLDKLEDIHCKLKICPQLGTFSTVGISDPALVLFWERMVEWYPDAKWIVVKRPEREVVKSCAELKLHIPNIRQKLWRDGVFLQQITQSVNPLVLDFYQINSETVLKIEDYLGVNLGPKERIEMLLNFNVQIDPKILRKRIASVKSNPPQFIIDHARSLEPEAKRLLTKYAA